MSEHSDVRLSVLLADYGAAADLLAGYAGEAADDTPGRPGAALSGYLRWAAAHPAQAATAAVQLRQLMNDPESVPKALFDTVPLTPEGERADAQWANTVAAILDHAVDTGFPPPGPPATSWEWNRRFPALSQFLGCHFTQDFKDEFADHDAATAAWARSATPVDRARLTGEISELLALDLTDIDLDQALAALGMDVEPPLPASAWLAHLARTVTGSPE